VHLKRGKDLVAKDTGGEHWRKAFLSVFITTLEPLFSQRSASPSLISIFRSSRMLWNNPDEFNFFPLTHKHVPS